MQGAVLVVREEGWLRQGIVFAFFANGDGRRKVRVMLAFAGVEVERVVQMVHAQPSTWGLCRQARTR